MVIRKELERNIPNEPNYDNIIPIKKYQVPYYDMPVSAGTGNPLDEEYPEKVDLTEQPPKGTDFIVRVSGDSMDRHITTAISYSSKNSQVLKSVKSEYLLWNGNAIR